MKLSREHFEKLALEQLDMLYRVAKRLTRDPGRAEDLVQETFLRALRAGDSFDLQEYGIRPWLMRIMQNLHVSRAEREQRQPHAIDGEQLDASAAAPVRDLPLEIGSSEAMDEQLVHALDDLPGEYQTVMLLWAVEDFSYKEIAEALDIPIGTVMSRLHRAKGRLAEQLHDYAVKEGVIREFPRPAEG
jgi:RNA polymerase sigma-70 factor (ECF subfamily)